MSSRDMSMASTDARCACRVDRTGAQLQPRILNGIPTFTLAHQQASRGVMRPHPGARCFGGSVDRRLKPSSKPNCLPIVILLKMNFSLFN
ncbi:hypothetical protein [Variovorax sp.]|jgi:hypothetical protein|uniref:hypothetical protein n=1 Tax=Variovorax sp. TaxID=1871043 RepID=UPI0037D9FF91